MKPGNYKIYWAKWLKRERKDFPALLAHDPYSHWSSNPRADGIAETLFNLALSIALSRYEGPEGRVLAERAVEVCDRALAEGVLRKGRNKNELPLNEGHANCCRAYATFLSGKPLPVQLLSQSTDCIARWFSPGSAGKPVGETQKYLISALSSALVSGNSSHLDRIRTLVPKLDNWKKYSKVLLALCDLAIAKSDMKPEASSLLEDFDKLFDTVRKPTFGMPLLSFELAYLRGWMTSRQSNATTLAKVIDLLLY